MAEGEKGEEGWGKRWDMAKLATHLGFDLMGAVLFGCEFGTVQKEGEFREMAESIAPVQVFLYWVSPNSSFLNFFQVLIYHF